MQSDGEGLEVNEAEEGHALPTCGKDMVQTVENSEV